MKIFPTHIVAVAGLVRNKEGQILLMKHPKRGWEIPGGQVEVGEDLITALKREAVEETGIHISVGQLAGVYSNLQTDVQYDGVSPVPTKVIFDFLAVIESGELQTSEESLEVGWFAEGQVLNLVTHPMTQCRVANLLSFDGQVTYAAYSLRPFQLFVERKV